MADLLMVSLLLDADRIQLGLGNPYLRSHGSVLAASLEANNSVTRSLNDSGRNEGFLAVETVIIINDSGRNEGFLAGDRDYHRDSTSPSKVKQDLHVEFSALLGQLHPLAQLLLRHLPSHPSSFRVHACCFKLEELRRGRERGLRSDAAAGMLRPVSTLLLPHPSIATRCPEPRPSRTAPPPPPKHPHHHTPSRLRIPWTFPRLLESAPVSAHSRPLLAPAPTLLSPLRSPARRQQH
eukprot:412897-Rhodomonas_salina.2